MRWFCEVGSLFRLKYCKIKRMLMQIDEFFLRIFERLFLLLIFQIIQIKKLLWRFEDCFVAIIIVVLYFVSLDCFDTRTDGLLDMFGIR